MNEGLKNILELMDDILNALSGKAEGFFLGGGTALSKVYFDHRKSFDLDFFAKDFSEAKIKAIIKEVAESLKIQMPVLHIRRAKGEANIIVCEIPVEKNQGLQVADNEKYLKLDFIEDVYRNLGGDSPLIHGVSVMSKENIYLRKIYPAFGYIKAEDIVGVDKFIGGRQEPKDIFDLYYLSTTFMSLSKFMSTYCNLDEKMAAITWHRHYDRLALKSEILYLITDKVIDCRAIVKHFESEIENIIKEISGVA